MGFDASYYGDLQGRTRALVMDVEEFLSSEQVGLLWELADANESGVAVEMVSDLLVERRAPITGSVLVQVESLVAAMGLPQKVVEALRPLAEPVSGHRARVSAQLLGTCEGGLKAAVEPGYRSMLFVFDRLGEDEGPMNFGAVVEKVSAGGVPGGGLDAVVWFWADLAEVYATPGTGFELSYAGRTVGSGEIVNVRTDLEDAS